MTLLGKTFAGVEMDHLETLPGVEMDHLETRCGFWGSTIMTNKLFNMTIVLS